MPYWYTIAGQRLLTIFGRQPEHSANCGARWLHPREQAQLAEFQSSDRRAGWLRGRLAIKQLIRYLEPQPGLPEELEIVSRDAQRNLGCAPRVFTAGDELNWQPSLTHSARHYAACIAHDARHAPGIDLVEHSELQPEQLRFWLREDERERLDQLAADQTAARRALARLWGGKEAAFKTLPAGTPFQPQRIEIQDWDKSQMISAWRTTDDNLTGALRWDELPNLTLTMAVRHE